MASKMIMLPLVSLLALTATAMPVAENSGEIACPGNVLVDKWGYVVSVPHYNFTRGVGKFRGCASEIEKRDTQYQTTVELGDASFMESWYPDSTGEPRTTPAHDELISRYTEVCGDTYCDGQKSISTNSGGPDGAQLVMSLDGEFADATLRDNFVALVKIALDKSTTSTSYIDGQIIRATGSGFFNAVSGYGDASGYSLTVRITNQDASLSCPDALNTINSFGELAPGLSTVFGLAGAICGAV